MPYHISLAYTQENSVYKPIYHHSSGGFGTNVPGLFKAKAGNLLLNWGWTTEQSLRLGHRLVVRPRFEPWTFALALNRPGTLVPKPPVG